ncbi:MAG: helix-turn-helix transcriptional regulator [Clostridia bacterium]|nr:helix-turn-helix transcriptional regulator [Clostridia bacterium]
MKFSSILEQYKINIFTVQKETRNIRQIRTHTHLPTYRFLLLEHGSIHYESDHVVWEMKAGDILYTPAFLEYNIDVLCGTIFTNVFFQIIPNAADNTLPFWDPVIFRGRHDMAEIIRHLLSEETEHRTAYKPMQDALLRQLLVVLYRESSDTKDRNTRTIAESILHYINNHCEERISRETLHREFHYHPNYINALIIRSTGMTFHRYLTDARIHRAKVMLSETDLSITEIALKLCFYDSSHFSSTFMKKTGMTPTEFRNLF